MFQTKFKRIDVPEEKNSGELLVEQEYISTEKQIISMLRAGKRLYEFRKENYDFNNGEEDFLLNPVREPNFDLADASAILNGIVPKVAESDNSEVEKTPENTLSE